MAVDVPALWTSTSPYLLTVLGVLVAVLLTAIYRTRRARETTGRVPAAVVAAAIGAVVCTAYSADTSWNFAGDHLGMTSTGERAMMFAAAELGLFAMAFMARQNLRTDGAPGTPGVLVWIVTGVQVIPAYSESGIVAGTVRAFVGPVLSALLWHQAMGIELRHRTGADSQSFPAMLAREARERLLSWLGLAQRGRDAEQITRDRWTRAATVRAARLADLKDAGAWPYRIRRARRRLAVAVDRTDAGVLPEQRTVLLERIGAYRHASQLASITLPSPWQALPVPEAEEVEVERVPAPLPAPEMYPELPAGAVQEPPKLTAPEDHQDDRGEADKHPAPPVPEAVPAGARLLPIVARPAGVPESGAVAAEAARTRLEVHAEYVPDPITPPVPEGQEGDGPDPIEEPADDSPPPPAEDTLTPQAREDFAGILAAGNVPSIRGLKTRYGIGQARAARIKTELERAA
ncbi:hypothetical protein ACFY97_13235 [Streptomyces klenkii]|uniref:hypothetical protein n=1 Tax=Streptomyces klenkii TaxID=1420899 RepID=UPI0036E7CBE8